MSANLNQNSQAAFSENDFARIRNETPIQQFEFHSELGSTSDKALELIDDDNLPLPLLVLAESQTAGRGQRDRQWWSSAGALTFSMAVGTDDMELPPQLWPKVSLTAGLAICEALEALLPGEVIRIKWPNDVYVQGRKICGILVESPNLRRGRLVIGVGINVNNSVKEAPAEIAEIAVAMCDVSGKQIELVDVLIPVVRNLVDRLRWLGSRDDELKDLWSKRCLLTGLSVAVDNAAGRLEGVCQGIDADGALLVQTDGGVERCLAGPVAILER